MKPALTFALGFVALALLPPSGVPGAERDSAKAIELSRDIRPILSENCYQCHGPDVGRREADLRLDMRDAAVSAGAIVPGKPEESLLVDRIFSQDPDEAMPPSDSNKKLSTQQKALLKRWIAEGAVYQEHWASRDPGVKGYEAVLALKRPRWIMP